MTLQKESFAMYTDIIRECAQLPQPVSFYCGLELPEKFALPDNILLFSHAWHPGRHETYTTNRHRLEIVMPSSVAQLRAIFSNLAI